MNVYCEVHKTGLLTNTVSKSFIEHFKKIHKNCRKEKKMREDTQGFPVWIIVVSVLIGFLILAFVVTNFGQKEIITPVVLPTGAEVTVEVTREVGVTEEPQPTQTGGPALRIE